MIRYYTTLIFSLLLPLFSPAQELNIDSLMKEAKVFADAKRYDEAIRIITDLKDQHPENVDYTIWLGRVYSWKGDYTMAAAYLVPVIKNGKAPMEAFEALTNTYSWSMQYDTAMKYVELGLQQFPDAPSLLLNKAFLLERKGNDKEALRILEGLKGKLDKDKKYEVLHTTLLRKKKNLITLSYLNTSFNNPGFDPWHLASIEYKRDLNKAPLIARLNYGNLYNNRALQFEIESYPKITKSTYIFANLGVADGKAVFPNVKAALELYTSLKHWTASIGGRFLNFKPDPVYIFSGHLGYQFSGWHLQYRPFAAQTSGSWSLSHALSAKKVNELKESFIQFDFQYGVIPFAFFTTNDVSRIKSTRFGIQYRFRVAECIFFQPAFMYEREEYYPKLYRNRYNTQLSVGFRF